MNDADARAAELALCARCASGDVTAIAELEARYFGEIDRALASLDREGDLVAEIRQRVRTRLFVRHASGPGAVESANVATRPSVKGHANVPTHPSVKGHASEATPSAIGHASDAMPGSVPAHTREATPRSTVGHATVATAPSVKRQSNEATSPSAVDASVATAPSVKRQSNEATLPSAVDASEATPGSVFAHPREAARGSTSTGAAAVAVDASGSGVAHASEPPGITRFAGSGPLGRWLVVVATREALMYLRATRRERARAHAASELAARDYELHVLRREYRPAFERAFADALAELSSKDRNLLYYHLVGGLGIDRIGALYRVHRVTAFRWLRDARAALVARTRELLAERMQLATDELESLLRLVQSRASVSVERLLRQARTDSIPA